MIRVFTNRLGVYISRDNKTVFIDKFSHRRYRSDLLAILARVEISGSGVIPLPSTLLIDDFNSLYAAGRTWGNSADFARLVVHSASMLSRRSVLA